MIDPPAVGLRVVGPEDLSAEARECLRPGELLKDRAGVERRLPSFFYEIPSWEAALETRLARDFGLWELIDVDVREPEVVRRFPRYVPLSISILAGQLQLLRSEVGKVVRIAANGGYRSPAHRFSAVASPHSWGTAANIYRVGDDWLGSPDTIQKYADLARKVLPHVWIRRVGAQPGYAFDHLHIDLGYFAVEPHGSYNGTRVDATDGGQN
jgi:hypothetical protein